MGVGATGRDARALAGAAWVLAVAFAAAQAALSPAAWGGLLAVAVLGLGAGRRSPHLGAALAAVVAAPLLSVGWAGAGRLGGISLALAILSTALAWRQASPGRLPRAVGAVVLGVAVVEAARQALLNGPVSTAGGLVAPLLLLGLAGASAAAIAPGWPPRVALAGIAGLGLWSAAQSAATAPDSVGAAQRLARWGAVGRHEATLVARPALGLAAVAAAPREHALAGALVEAVGLHRVLAAGWRPNGAPLSPEQRLDAARWLDAQGRGGEALRLLWPARRADPAVAWWAAALAREQGRGDLTEAEAEVPVRLAEARPLPGAVPLDLALDTNGAHTVLLEMTRPLASLEVQIAGSAYQGPPILAVRACGPDVALLAVPADRRWLTLAEDLPAGPCRLSLRFTNDLHGADGDRNIRIDALRGR